MFSPSIEGIAPLQAPPEQLALHIREAADRIGYEPEALLIMARKPRLLECALDLARVTIVAADHLEPDLRALVNIAAAFAAGSFYTSTHLVHSAHHANILSWERLRAIPDFEESTLFTTREKAAMRLAATGARLLAGPISEARRAALALFTETEVIEIIATVSAIALFAHWNAMTSPMLEAEPAEVLEQVPWLQSLDKRADHDVSIVVHAADPDHRDLVTVLA